MEGEQVQFFRANNPLDQELILKLVLAHVGKTDVNDLMNCRLVSHSWNRLAVQLLDQLGCTARLDYGRLVKYKALLWKTQVRQRPGTPSLEPKELANLKLQLTCIHCYCDDDLSEVAEAAQLLMAYPHLRVAAIHHEYDFPLQEETNHELFKLMELVAKDLESMNTSLPANFRQRHSFEEFDFDCYTSLQFPKLTSVYHQMYSSSAMLSTGEETEVPDGTKHIASIIQNAPNLTKLNLQMLDETTAGCVRRVLQVCPPGLQELFVGEGAESAVTHVLPELKFPGLKVLKLDNLHDLSPRFSDFLKHNCPALISLEINLSLGSFDEEEDDVDVEEAEEDFQVEFPILPNIAHIGFGGYEENLPSFVRRIFNGMLTQFPNTHSLSIDFPTLMMLGKHLSESGHEGVLSPAQHPVFTNISTLAVALPSSGHKLRTGMDHARRIYLHTFPNVKTLIIRSGQRIRALELLCSNPGIQALEIHSKAFRYLETVTENNPLLLQGLQRLKLVEPKRYEDVGFSNLFLSRFPALKFVELPADAVSPTQIKSLYQLQLRALKLRHPRIEFHLTNQLDQVTTCYKQPN